MAARLTVVLDDDEMYRRAKIRAVEEGVPLKVLIEEALRNYLEGAEHRAGPAIAWDWDEYDRWQEEVEQLGEELGDSVPADLSDIKHHLYGAPRRAPVRLLAEERTPYTVD